MLVNYLDIRYRYYYLLLLKQNFSDRRYIDPGCPDVHGRFTNTKPIVLFMAGMSNDHMINIKKSSG